MVGLRETSSTCRPQVSFGQCEYLNTLSFSIGGAGAEGEKGGRREPPFFCGFRDPSMLNENFDKVKFHVRGVNEFSCS